jgi:hypothetical protein
MPRAGFSIAATAVLIALLGLGCNGGSSGPPPTLMTQEQLRDPQACQSCHPDHVKEWSGSMHAYASDDPVFQAMNKRAQRETNGALGDFCVRCHAPMAVRDGKTTDGLNLAQLPAPAKGVTCYFCHSAQSVEGTHNNPLTLATDGTMFGPFSDPAPIAPHRSAYGALLDPSLADSAAACGSCHDIVNMQGAHVERTFQEWQDSRFSIPQGGLTCGQSCHMDGRDGPASTTTGSRIRRLHSHTLAGVDVALSDFPEAGPQRDAVQTLLNGSLQATLCLDPLRKQIQLSLDNVGGGHGFPSGATPDRRAWVELTAYAQDAVIYQSGHVAADQTVETLSDPDLWLIRDCIYDAEKKETPLFWQAASLISNQLPAAVVNNVSDPASFNKSHYEKTYPADATKGLDQLPDRITVQVHVKAIGDDILADLVASGDLDPSVPPKVPTFEPTGSTIEWTRAAAGKPVVGSDGQALYCILPGPTYRPTPNRAQSHAHCPAQM